MQIVKYISILLGLTLSVSAIAQSGYIDLPSDSAEWFVEIKGPNGGNKGTDERTQKIRYFVMGDTLINDTTYIPLFEESDGRILVQYYLYQDSIRKRVYFKQLHWDEGILLYDFGLNVGDFFYHTFLGEIEVIEVDTIVIDEVSRRKIVFNQTFYIDPYISEYCFIEGIGSNAGLFTEDYLGLITSMLTCFKSKGASIYPEVLHENGCDLNNYVYTNIVERFNPDFSIYPSPFKDFITIESVNSESAPFTIQVYNLQGIQVYNAALDSMEETSINLSELESGIYFLQITIRDRIANRHKLIKL